MNTSGVLIRTYRPDIDGLRALAILAVLIYHADKSLLPGGFLGVDVFLVISGFLIGRILISKVATGEMSAKTFMMRRVKRLLPVFLTVLLVSAVAGTLLMAPHQLAKFGDYLIFSVFGLSNLRFAFGDSYFEIAPDANPLLHTWSLGLEEQFYAGALILAVIAHRRRRTETQISLWLILLGSVSFVIALTTPLVLSEQINFFWLPSRAWEFVVGIVIAHYSLRRNRGSSTVPQEIGSLVGLALIVISFLFLGELSNGPGLFSLFPVLGAGLVIWNTDGSQTGKLLGSFPLRTIGRLSYGIYLWHYPFFAFGRIALPDTNDFIWLSSIPIVVLIASGSYFLVERPLQRRQTLSARSTISLMASCAAVFAFGTCSIVSGGIPVRLSGMPAAEADTLSEGPQIIKEGSSALPLLLVGDSHMAALGPAIVAGLQTEDRTIASFHKGACPFILGLELAHKSKLTVGRGCDSDLQEERLRWIDSFGPSQVVLFARWSALIENPEGPVLSERLGLPYFLREPGTQVLNPELSLTQVKIALRKTVASLESRGHKVIIIYPVPEPELNVPETLMRQYYFNGWRWPISSPLTISSTRNEDLSKSAYEALDYSKSARTESVYPSEVFCSRDKGSCATHSNSEIFYYDTNHLSKAGAVLLANNLKKKLGFGEIKVD